MQEPDAPSHGEQSVIQTARLLRAELRELIARVRETHAQAADAVTHASRVRDRLRDRRPRQRGWDDWGPPTAS
jgi:hypothetical protein